MNRGWIKGWLERLVGDRMLLVLALPSLGLALVATIVTTYVPVLIADLTGPVVTGLLIGTEGILALILPVAIGRWSDRLETPYGGRIPFLVVAAPFVVSSLVLMPLAGTVIVIACLIVGFYTAYLTYGTPYRAVYPDLVPERLRGRSQGVQQTLRESGTGLALVSGGLLLAIWQPLPFLAAAAVFAAVTAGFVFVMLRRDDDDEKETDDEPGGAAGRGGDEGGEGDGGEDSEDAGQPSMLDTYKTLGENRSIRSIVVANGLWELALGAIKTFVVLFITVGLDRPATFASLVLGGAVAAVVLAALVGGALADRVGHLRLLRICTAVYGVGLIVPALTQSELLIAVIPVAAFAAGVTMTLSFSVLMGLLPDGGHGSGAALFELSRGVGTLLGPVLAGTAIQLLEPVFDDTEGYAAMWLVAAAAVLASLLALRSLEESAD